LTAQELAIVHKFYHQFGSTAPLSTWSDEEAATALHSSSFPAYPADGMSDESPLTPIERWLLAACLLLLSTAVLAGWVWLVRHLLAP